MESTNIEGQPGETGLAHGIPANAEILLPSTPDTIAKPMHAIVPEETIAAREQGMRSVLAATSQADRVAIGAALTAGFRKIGVGRATDALESVGFAWPESAPARCLGPITSALARSGLITQEGITYGLAKRSHAGRTSIWRWVGGAA